MTGSGFAAPGVWALSKPPPPSPAQAVRIGQYARGDEVFDVFEREGRLMALLPDCTVAALLPFRRNRYVVNAAPGEDTSASRQIGFSAAEAPLAYLTLQRVRYPRRDFGEDAIAAFQASLDSSSAPPGPPMTCPASDGLRPDLVAVQAIAKGLREDMRYATSRNFLGFAIYDRPEAFLHRPAAEALRDADADLARYGYGLVIHDAYRPWSVTKLFWDNVPEQYRGFIADPSVGSVHNRGCAVDVSLLNRSTGLIADMPSRYDEPTGRSASAYPGGSSLQRWHRGLLDAAMSSHGFKCHPAEWWHFDFEGWEQVAVADRPLESL